MFKHGFRVMALSRCRRHISANNVVHLLSSGKSMLGASLKDRMSVLERIYSGTISSLLVP